MCSCNVQSGPQTAERASTDVMATKDAFIDDLRTQLLESMGKVRTALYKVLYAVHGLIDRECVSQLNKDIIAVNDDECYYSGATTQRVDL